MGGLTVFPVLRAGRALAILTIPYVSTSYSEVPLEAVKRHGAATAAELSAALAGG